MRLVVYDETEKYLIDNESVVYPFHKRKNFVGPPVQFVLRDYQEDLHPPYLTFEYTDTIKKPSVSKFSL